jgi:biopolymer transport protein TolQ
MGFVMGNSLWHLVEQSDAISKFVMLLLLCMSIACWAVFIGKLMLTTIHQRQLRAILKVIKTDTAFKDLVLCATEHNNSFAGYFLSKQLIFLNLFFKSRSHEIPHVTQLELDMLLNHLDQTVDSFTEKERELLPILSTCAGVAPLLGLFGTVWGLIHAFIRISERQVADITTVAPGIAEALTTTLAGLMVAIPALVMFNYLQIHVHKIGLLVQQLADRVAVIVQYSMLTKESNAPYQTSTPTSQHDRPLSDITY